MKMIEKGITEIECLEKVHDDYNQKLDREHGELIWPHPGITSWYKNQSGRIVSIMPWRLVDYWQFTREPKLIDYKVSHKQLWNYIYRTKILLSTRFLACPTSRGFIKPHMHLPGTGCIFVFT